MSIGLFQRSDEMYFPCHFIVLTLTQGISLLSHLTREENQQQKESYQLLFIGVKDHRSRVITDS